MDLGAGRVLRGDELAAEDAARVDDVGLGELEGAVEAWDARGGVAQGEQVDAVVEQEAAVGSGVVVLADGEDGELREAVLKFHQAGQFLDAGKAPCGPEVEDDDAATKLGERDGAAAVGEGELGGWGADAGGVVAAVAGGERERAEREEKNGGSKSRSGFTHARPLLPIIRICERCGRRGGDEGGGFDGCVFSECCCGVWGGADAAVGGSAGAQ